MKTDDVIRDIINALCQYKNTHSHLSKQGQANILSDIKWLQNQPKVITERNTLRKKVIKLEARLRCPRCGSPDLNIECVHCFAPGEEERLYG